jgi:3-dehydroquinate synthase
MSIRYTLSLKTEVIHADWELMCSEISGIRDRKLFIIDEKVLTLYHDRLQPLLLNNNLLVIKASEENKSLEQVTTILSKMAETNLRRNDAVIALGGGIILDLAGLAASLFKRGCKLIFIPTTFLAMIDAAIGGKTAINYNGCKNLIGTFYPASQVIVNRAFVETLSSVDLLNGWAECIKISLLMPNNLYKKILSSDQRIDQDIIRQAIRLKEKLCRNDLYDSKLRRKLNLGHTFAHLLESVSDYQIPHGLAVAIGIGSAAKLSLQMNLIDQTVYEKIVKPLDMFSFPENIREEIKERLKAEGHRLLSADKKKTSQQRVVLFKGFQQTRIMSIKNPQILIDLLLV